MASGTSTDLEGRVGDGARGAPDAIDDEGGDDDVGAEGKDVSSKSKGNHRCRGCRGRGVDGEEHIDDADDAGYGSSLMVNFLWKGVLLPKPATEARKGISTM